MDSIDNTHTDVIFHLCKLWPKQTQDRLAASFTLVLLPSLFLLELLLILPHFHPVGCSSYNWRLGSCLWFLFSFYSNLYQLVSVGPNGFTADLPSIICPGFKYCHSCRLNGPPRMYHCPVCDRCIFKRDHHCSFAAICVGHFNHRYFIVGASYIWLAMTLVVCWNWSFMWANLGGLRPANIWLVFVPHLAFLLRFVSIWQFLCTLLFITSAAIFVFCTYMIGAQAFGIFRGQTRPEFLMDIRAFDLGVCSNWSQIMGHRWALAFICAFFASPLPSNGLSFPTRCSVSIVESTKSI